MEQLIIIREGNKWIYAYEGTTIRGISTCCKISHPLGSAMARTFKQLWRSTDGFKIQNQGDNMVLFVFDNPNDVDRIILNQPWRFDKHIVMLQRWYTTDGPIHELDFTKTLF